MIKHHGEVADYRSSEGRTVRIPYKGLVDVTVKDILGGIRSTCTYVGAPTLKQLAKCTTFIKVSKQFNDVFLTSRH
jgi:GMP reductase